MAVTFASSGNQIQLPNPELGDRRRINLRVMFKRMMDGGIRSYKLGTPLVTLDLDFANLNRPKIVELLTWLNNTKGQEISYIDYNATLWNGRITNFPFETTHAALRNNAFQIVFEGKLNG